MSEPKSTFLFMREGSSDKVYNVHLENGDGGWSVRFQNGRRGKALRDGIKGEGLSFDEALALFDKTVKGKMKGGYTEDESGVAFSSAEFAGQSTGFRPQLLNEISFEEAISLGDDWLVGEKHDGERRGAAWDGARAIYSNRKGLETGVEAGIDAAFRRLGGIIGDLEVDCEDMGGHLVIFDVRKHFMMNADSTFRERASVLEHIEKTIHDAGLQAYLLVERPIPMPAFVAMGAHERMRESGCEGFVIRHKDSIYTPGRPNSGGDALKVKFWEDVTCRVNAGRDFKHSVGLELRDENGEWVSVGNVTIPSKMPLPEPGKLIDVKYLYAFPGGSLFEPSFKGVRNDLTEDDCLLSRLKMKVPVSSPSVSPEMS